MSKSIMDRFSDKYRVESSGCWQWVGAINEDTLRPTLRLRARFASPHRVSWLLHKGDIPANTEIFHTCGNKHCVNPVHLDQKTVKRKIDALIMAKVEVE